MSLARLEIADRHGRAVAFLTLTRPERSNALVPELVDDLRSALADAEEAGVSALVLAGAGRFFSSGGDIAGFLEARDIGAYAKDLVGNLQQAVLSLLRFPVPVLTRLQGGVTGGSTGLVLAADLVAMDEKAFIQPYYSEVGFAPDGGWTALLPERIGPSRAYSILALNQRIMAEEALALGLVDRIAPASRLDAVIDLWLADIATQSRATLTATKRLVWDDGRISTVAGRLEAERQAFIGLIENPQTIEGMKRFLR